MILQELLEVKNISKSFGSTRAVDDISMSVRRGEILGFLGPNGAGKTTTIRMIMGINAPDSGTISFNYNRGGGIPRTMVGYLPEERGLYKEARVMDILQFLAGLKEVDSKEAKKKARQWLEKFELEDYSQSKIEELSKGMAQKIQFIACVLHQPEMLVFDEPFSGLDPVSQDIFKEEIRNLAEKGRAVMLSSHRMNLVEEICDRIILIHQGQEVVSGSLDDIKARFGNFRLKINSSYPESLEGVLSGLSGIESLGREGGSFLLTLKRGSKPLEIIHQLPEDIPVEGLSAERISLHDIFVRVARGGGIDENDLENISLGDNAQSEK